MIEYREPPFNRVWVRIDPKRRFRTTYGLDKQRRIIECEVHWDAGEEGHAYTLREIADIVIDEKRFIRQVHWERELERERERAAVQRQFSEGRYQHRALGTRKPHRAIWVHSHSQCLDCRQVIESCCEGRCGDSVRPPT